VVLQACTSIKCGHLPDEKSPQIHLHLASTYGSITTFRYVLGRHCQRETSSADFWAHYFSRHKSLQSRPHPPELSCAHLSGNHPSLRSPERLFKPSAFIMIVQQSKAISRHLDSDHSGLQSSVSKAAVLNLQSCRSNRSTAMI
jgi:hypothetical protein